jgi:hypothetical protein
LTRSHFSPIFYFPQSIFQDCWRKTTFGEGMRGSIKELYVRNLYKKFIHIYICTIYYNHNYEIHLIINNY